MQKKELQDMDKEVLDSYMCPSFNSYSTDQLAGIAEQVGRVHYRAQNDDAFTPPQNDDSDFEFVAFRKSEDDDEEVFFDDTVFPLFNSDLLREHRNSRGSDSSAAEDLAALRFQMGRLLIGGGEDRRRKSDPPPSSSESSSESDDLEGIPAGTYCVWTPNSPQASPSRCKKSNSTGSSSSSKRWKLLDLLRRSSSTGKESFVFLKAPSSSPAKKKAKEQWSTTGSVEVAGKPKAKGVSGAGEKKKVPPPAHEALYLRNRELRRVDKKRSFLPYRQDLVGFCTSRLGKAFPSF